MTPLAEIARQAWLDCPLDGDHWQATVDAVEKAVLERAIEAANRVADNFHEQAQITEIDDDAEGFDLNGFGARRVAEALTALKDKADESN